MTEIVPADNWTGAQKIVVVLAHPDDPEFFCGGSIAKWIKMGHEVVYYLLTMGDKGSSDPCIHPADVERKRVEEQKAAAAVLGISNVNFLNYKDGYLIPDLGLRRDVTRIIRKEKPSILVSCDPTNIYPRPGAVNHPDHRAVGQVVVDAVFPAAGNISYFPELLREGYHPHMVKEVWLSVAALPNVTLDVTEEWAMKMKALFCHRSQIGDPDAFLSRMLLRRTPDSSESNPRYEEKFYRIVFG